MVVRMVGAISGRTTERRRCHQVAPSRCAASTRSLETFWSAARYIKVEKGAPFQMAAKMIATMTVSGWASQAMLRSVTWIFIRNALTSPR